MVDGRLTRKEAKLQGLKRYMPDKPCTHGHTCERYVGNNDCVECSAIRAAKYAIEHREEAKLRAEMWRTANPEKHRQNARNSIARDPQRNRDKAKEWAAQNPERVQDNARAGYERNREKRIQQAKEWAKANPGRRREIMAANRAARKAARIPLTEEQQEWMREIYDQCPEGYEVDHIYPLRAKNSCGLHVPWNLQYLTVEENRAKSNKMPEDLAA